MFYMSTASASNNFTTVDQYIRFTECTLLASGPTRVRTELIAIQRGRRGQIMSGYSKA